MMNMLGEIMVYLVEIYNCPQGNIEDLRDDMYLCYPRDQKVSYDELMEWYKGDLKDKKVEIYQARCGSFNVTFDRNGVMDMEVEEVDCSTGLNGSPIEVRYYDEDGNVTEAPER